MGKNTIAIGNVRRRAATSLESNITEGSIIGGTTPLACYRTGQHVHFKLARNCWRNPTCTPLLLYQWKSEHAFNRTQVI